MLSKELIKQDHEIQATQELAAWTIANYNNEVSAIVSHENLDFAINFVQKHIDSRHSSLSCLTGTDLADSVYRFAIAYDLLSIKYNNRLRLKVQVNELTAVPTLTNYYNSADWWEREAWDLYGIFFFGHKDLRRILTDYGFEGHPMRKDFPLVGHVEVRYDTIKGRVVIEPVELAQEFRHFNYDCPWNY